MRQRCQDLALKFADADSDDDSDFERKWDALEHALKEWAAELRARRGGIARALALSPERKTEIAKAAATARIAISTPEERSEQARMGGRARSISQTREQRRELALLGNAAHRAKFASPLTGKPASKTEPDLPRPRKRRVREGSSS